MVLADEEWRPVPEGEDGEIAVRGHHVPKGDHGKPQATYPREVEEVLITHPAVSLAAVVGVPDDRYGEEVQADVIRAAGAELGEQELVQWAKSQMAAHTHPRVTMLRPHECEGGATTGSTPRGLR